MRHYACLVACLCLATVTLSAQDVLLTAKNPTSIVQQGELVHVLTHRVDANFNGILELGDVPAAWHRFNTSGLAIGESVFPWADVRGNRPAIDAVNERMFVVVGDSIYAISTAFMVQQALPMWGQGGVALALLTDTILLVSVRPNFTDPGAVHMLSTRTGLSAGPSINAGVNVQGMVVLDSATVLVLSEGNFGSLDGELSIATRGATSWLTSTLANGGTANHVVVDNGLAFVTMNGSHEVVVVDVASRAVTRRILTGTTGYAGPRESAVHDGRLFVSTFNNDIRIFDIASGMLVGHVEVDARPEGIAIIDGKLWVCRTFDRDSYTPASGVNIYTLNDITSVFDVLPRALPTRVILATSNVVRLAGINAHRDVSITSVQGSVQQALVVDAASSSVNIATLSSGLYFASDGTITVAIIKP